MAFNPQYASTNNFTGYTNATTGTCVLGVTFVGATNIVLVAALGSGNVPSSVTDNRGSTYNLLYTQNFTSPIAGTLSLYYANINTALSITTTVNFASSTTFEIQVSAFAGLSSTPLTVETSNSGSGTSTSPSSGVTPQNATATDLLLGIGMTNIASGDFTDFFSAAGSGWTQVGDSSGDPVSSYIEWQQAATTTTYTATATINNSKSWLFAVVAIKQATPTPQFVRNYGTSSSAGASSLTLTGATLSAGDFGILYIKWVSATQTISSVVDNLGGNTWIPVPNTFQRLPVNNNCIQLYYCQKIATGGTATFTVTFSGGVTVIVLSGAEFTAASLDQSLSAQNTSSNNPTINVTPSVAPNTIYCASFCTQTMTIDLGESNPGAISGNNAHAYQAFSYAPTGFPIGFTAALGQWDIAALSMIPPQTDVKAFGDAYIFPYAPVRNTFGDAWIVIPQKQAFGDAYIVNPSNLFVRLSYVKLNGTVQFGINPVNGYVRFNSTLNTPGRQYISLLGTLVQKNNLRFVNLAGSLQIKSRGYVNLTATIQYRMTRGCSGDCVVTVFKRNYVTLNGTVIQKVNTSVGSGGSGGAQNFGQYPANTYVKMAAWMLNPRAGLP